MRSSLETGARGELETNVTSVQNTIGSVAQTQRLFESDSEVGHSFTVLAENLDALGRPVESVVVTSPESEAGRTTVCIGLGAALAASGKKVAVVDCNLDRPHLHRCFGRPNFTGLTSALEGGRDLENYGFEAAPNLRVIPTGPVLPGSGTLASSRKLSDSIKTLQQKRDVVLLDAPVAGEVLAATNLWGSFDGVLLVVHATRTPKGVARGFTDALLDARVNLFGVVLNGHV
jgi:Mrp family chromosome partitioning ATPase